MTEDFHLNLSGPGIQVTQTVSREKALELMAVLMGVVAASAGPQPVHGSATQSQLQTATGTAAVGAGRRKVGKRNSRRGSTGTSKGPTARILALKESGWFKTPRTVQEILAELARKGGNYKRTDLTRLMITLVDRDDLVRSKQVEGEGDKKVWHYSAQ